MNKLIMFVLGATLGSLVTWKIVETKYKQLADEEIESVRDFYKNKDKKEDVEESELDNTQTENKKEVENEVNDYFTNKELNRDKYAADYKEKVHELGYDLRDTIYMEPGVDFIDPYVIAPEEYGEYEGYDTRSWTYYADFVLTDELGNIVSEPEFVIGDALEHFGEYEDDSVCVRNENNECDYQIIKHYKTFTEINEEGS